MSTEIEIMRSLVPREGREVGWGRRRRRRGGYGMGGGGGGGEEARASVCLCPYIFEVRANFRCDRPLLDQDLKWGEGGRGRAAPSSIFIHFIIKRDNSGLVSISIYIQTSCKHCIFCSRIPPLLLDIIDEMD